MSKEFLDAFADLKKEKNLSEEEIKKGGRDVFLTKKAFVKILVITIAYFLLGRFCFVAGILISQMKP